MPQARPQPKPADSRAISAAFATAGSAPGDAPSAPGLTLALPPAQTAASGDAAGQPPAPPAANAGAAPQMQYVLADTVNVRAGPSVRTDSLIRLDRGEAVQVLPSDTPGWSKIRLQGDGREGYVASRFLGDAPGDGIFTPAN
ncbi:MAG: SH3 domain-containing protein [Rhodobacter sp.]|nr:SH3 domain-containing protein [Rhodobacter sp.]